MLELRSDANEKALRQASPAKQEEVQKTGVPQPPSVIVTQNNVPFFLAWKGLHVFTGGYKHD